jgi:integrase
MPKRKVGEIFKRGRIYCIRYYDGRGVRRKESSGSEKRADAERLLRKRLQAGDDGVPVDAQVGKLRFFAAANDVVLDYRTNGKRSLDNVERRIEKYLKPFFGDRKLATITTAEVRAFIHERQQSVIVSGSGDERKERHVSNGEINRELAVLKRIFSLALQAGKVLHRPHVPMLRENNVRTGFFEFEQFQAVRAHLPEPLRPVVTFAYVTGWRIASEVLPLQWRQVDLKAGEVRLDAGTTKNGEGRVFRLTDDLRALLDERRRETSELERKYGQIIPWVFYRSSAAATGRRRRSRSACSPRHGRRRASRPGAPVGSRTTSAERRFGTWCGAVCRSASR